MGVTPAMPTGCSLGMMMEEMPKRAFDVGIAEQHALLFLRISNSRHGSLL